MVRGAGKPHEIGEHMIQFLDAKLAYRDAAGYLLDARYSWIATKSS